MMKKRVSKWQKKNWQKWRKLKKKLRKVDKNGQKLRK